MLFMQKTSIANQLFNDLVKLNSHETANHTFSL